MPTAPHLASRSACEAADAADPLAGFRDRFALPPGVIYLDGNSLGPLPAAAPAQARATVEHEWGVGLIRSWNDADWYTLPRRLGDRVGGLIGAAAGQTVVCDTTSINIFKALKAAMGLRPGRSVVVAEAASFPTDLYVLDGALRDTDDWTARLIGRDGDTLADLLAGGDVGVVLLSPVDYRTGRLMDMPAITAQAQEAGALVIWDLCHAAGILPMDLDAWGVDMAVGCTYKYLNGGPGAPAFLYVAARHHAAARQPLSGWWGHADPFAFEADYRADAGIGKFLCGTQPILSMKGVEWGLDAMDGADMAQVRAKSQALTALFMDRVEALVGHGMDIVTPRDPDRRGSQVAIRFGHGYAVVQAMIERGVIGDFRAPDIMRFGFAPLYLSFTNVWDAVETLATCIHAQVWTDDRYTRRAAVT